MGDVPFSLVIPSLTGRADATIASVAIQTKRPAEIEVVRGVSPNGRARNIGVARTTSPVIVFVDDDARLTAETTLDSLVTAVRQPAVGAAGAAKLIPPGSSRFQRAVARQVPRIEHPVVERVTIVNPPADRHGYTDVTTTCCAIRRDVLEEVGGFDETLVRGVDSELFHRIRRAGYDLVLAPRAAVDHAAPATLRELLRKHAWYGIGYAQAVQRHPHLAAGRRLRTPLHAVAYLALRTLLLAPHAVVPYSYACRSVRVGFKPLGALASYAAVVGYVYGWYRHPYRRQLAE